MGFPRNKQWISEIDLYHRVRNLLLDQRVIHQARPKWLQPQTLDIYIPEIKLVIEYQGQQHYKPVEFFGGQEAFKKNKERDCRKARICKENDATVLYFRYDEVVTEGLITNVSEKHVLEQSSKTDKMKCRSRSL